MWGHPTPVAVRSLLARLYFVWTISVGVVASVLLVVPVVLANVLRPSARTFWRSMRVWCRSIFSLCGLRVEARGRAPEGPAVFVANHQGMIDIPVLLLGIDQPFVFVARKEIRRVPIVGAVLRWSRCVLIDRRAAGPGLAEAAQRVADGDSVLMFPEGTRSYGAGVAPFKTGAFRLAAAAGVPVVPVAVEGAAAAINEREKAGRPGTVRVCVGPPLDPLSDEPPAAWAERARGTLLDLMPDT